MVAKKKETKHDRKVRLEAKKLKNAGWNVQAAIPGYRQPKGIGKNKRIPDIVARKRGAERIIEVETPESANKDKEQQSSFRRRAGQKSRTTFKVVKTKK